jgi:hypothetical protein
MADRSTYYLTSLDNTLGFGLIGVMRGCEGSLMASGVKRYTNKSSPPTQSIKAKVSNTEGYKILSNISKVSSASTLHISLKKSSATKMELLYVLAHLLLYNTAAAQSSSLVPSSSASPTILCYTKQGTKSRSTVCHGIELLVSGLLGTHCIVPVPRFQLRHKLGPLRRSSVSPRLHIPCQL